MSMISPLSVLEIKSYTTLKQKKKFLNDVVKRLKFIGTILQIHTIKIFFHLNIVKDRGSKVDDYVYKIIKGKSLTET